MDTYKALEDAINAHALAQSGEDVAIVKDWVIVSAVSSVTDEPEREAIYIERAPQTSLYAVTGLLTWGLEAYDGSAI